MAITMYEGKLPHIYWIDLESDGTYTECAVVKRDQLGNIYFFPVNSLDSIDKKRLHKIVTNRNAAHFELWDLMSNITLNNGVNALEYFHQLVRVVAPNGRQMKPNSSMVGVSGGKLDTKSAEQRKAMDDAAQSAANAAASAAAKAAAEAVRGMSQPQAQEEKAEAPKRATRTKKEAE